MGRGGAWRGAVVAACALIPFALPGSAFAKHGLVTGFADGGGSYGSADPVERALWFDRTVDSGAGIVRLHAVWGAVAGSVPPSDPANPGSTSYDFARVDRAVRDAEGHGLDVLLTVTSAPAWAEGPGRPGSAAAGTWKPDPSKLADFMRAVAARYSGGYDPPGSDPPLPAVQALQVWNEPNLSDHLTPQYDGTTAISPGYYRNMLNAAYAAVKAVDPAMLVVTGGTAPYGDPPGGMRIRPVAFWEQVLCAKPSMTKKRKKAKRGAGRTAVKTPGCQATFDVLAHHPINTSGGPERHAINPLDASSADLDRVVRVLRAAQRAGTVLPGPHPVWATEMWWDSNPPNSAGAPLRRQARWVEQAMYLAWKGGASAVINLEIRDSSSGPHDVLGGADSGIFFANGRRKPAFRAFRFPFVASRIKGGTLRAWGKAPRTGKLVIQRMREKRWVTVKKLRVRQGAIFLAKLRLAGSQRLRAVVPGNRSLAWTQR